MWESSVFSVLRSSETTKVGQIQVWWRSGVQSSPVKWVNVRKCWEEWKTLWAQFMPLKVPCVQETVSFHTTFNIRTCAQWTERSPSEALTGFVSFVNWQKRKPQTAAEEEEQVWTQWHKQTSKAGLGGRPESRALSQKQTKRREERRGRREVGGLSAVHVNSKHSSDWVGFLEQSRKRPSKNKQLAFNTGPFSQYLMCSRLHFIIFFSMVYLIFLLHLFTLIF